jgi:hypothetical protein
LTGDLASGGGLPATSGTLSTNSLTIPANASSGTITYSPPAIMPSGTTLTLTLGAPIGPTPSSAQTATLNAPTVHTVTLSGPTVGCAAYTGIVRNLGAAGTQVGNEIAGVQGYTAVFAMPVSGNTGFGVMGLYPTPYTPKSGPAITEVKISKCKGDFTDDGDGCYQASAAIDGGQINQYWAKQYTTRYPDQAAFVKYHRCLINTSYSTWYINVRLLQYPAGTACGNACGWIGTWKTASTS